MATIDVGPPKVDLLRVRAGDRNLFTIRLTQDGQPFPLTGMIIEAQARVTPTTPEIALTAVCTILDAPNGLFEIRWPGADVQALLNGANLWSGVWDLQVGNGSDPQTLMSGVFTAEADVTR
jgi:hypothetical protein